MFHSVFVVLGVFLIRVFSRILDLICLIVLVGVLMIPFFYVGMVQFDRFDVF